MSCDRKGEHYFAARNHVGGRRGTSLAIAMSVAISATILLLKDPAIPVLDPWTFGAVQPLISMHAGALPRASLLQVPDR